MKRFLANLCLLCIIFTFASCSKDDIKGDEYYVKYSVSASGSYEVSYSYTNANGERISKRRNPQVLLLDLSMKVFVQAYLSKVFGRMVAQ